MVRISVLYPAGEGTTFDMDYYLSSHIPMMQRHLGDALQGVTVDQGLSGGGPNMGPPYVAITQLTVESIEAFQAALAEHMAEVMGDIANFTNASPEMQFSEVRL
jgi:uncharacterized protein (TIGR02118 family)